MNLRAKKNGMFHSQGYRYGSHRPSDSAFPLSGRLAVFLLAALILFCQLPLSRAEEAIDRKAILDRVAELEPESGKLRSVVVHVYNVDDPVLPTAKDTPDTAFLKHLSVALESRFALAEEESQADSPEKLLALFRQYTESELETLAEYETAQMKDPLLGFLAREYLKSLKDQQAALEGDGDTVTLLWKWNACRQEGIKALFFLNRYYKVSVHRAWKDRMNSFLYEGALLVSENTISEMLSAQAETEEPEKAETVSASPSDLRFGSEEWHEIPGSKYEFRIFGFDSESLTLKSELRDTEKGTVIPRNDISLSVWEKHQKNRYSLATFYKADEIAVQDGKVSFLLHMNVLLDGRLYKELTGRISLKLSDKKASGDGDGLSAAEFPEKIIHQDFSGVSVGDILLMGYYEQDGNAGNLREPIEWKVISINKKKNVALIVSVKGLEAVSYSKPGDESFYLKEGFNWKNSYIRSWMNSEFYDNSFTKEEKSRIRIATNVTKDPSGRFTTKERVFLLSSIEARRYMNTKEKMACEPTAHALEKLAVADGAFVEDKYCIWWVRELTNAYKLNRDGKPKANSCNEAGYVSGSTGMRFFSRHIGLKVYQADMAVARPAMWILLD